MESSGRSGRGSLLATGWWLVPLFALHLAACTSLSPPQRRVSDISPLELDGHSLAVEEVAARVSTPDLLAMDADMRDFVMRYAGGSSTERQRLYSLHRAVRGPATLGVEYDALASGSARDVFHRGTANCLSYATLFVAMAREAGLDAGYQWLEVRPQWTRDGERVLVRLHVNVAVRIGRRQEYMVDIDPLESRDISASHRLSDTDAEALYHSNLAMRALGDDELETAWLQGVRALQLSPQLAQLWVNLGAIYRRAGQHRAAEASYLYALDLDPWEWSAMNNLVVLYTLEGNVAERERWDRRVAGHREANPYYHAWLGDQAADEGNWPEARDNYRRALELAPADSRLLYALGQAHEQLGEPGEALDLVRRAMQTATLRTDVEAYSNYLESLQRSVAAGS